MLTVLVILFVVGYAGIAMEHKINVNKAATALLMAGVLWMLYILTLPYVVPNISGEAFGEFLKNNPSVAAMPLWDQCVQFITGVQIVESLGEISETLFFLLGAMTIVELIDLYGGFTIVTNRITTRKKWKLLWIVSCITFVMSAVLDNMTTAIVMTMLAHRLVPNYKERWVFAGMIIIAANSGGAWSPIGDVTTIMLWVNGNVSTGPLMQSLILPSLVSMLVPLLIATRILHGVIKSTGSSVDNEDGPLAKVITRGERKSIFILGICCLLAVPVFKSLTHLPPFMGILISLSVIWVYTEILYQRKKSIGNSFQMRVVAVLRRIDLSTILFFLGILLAVSALQSVGILGSLAAFLDKEVHNVFVIDIVIGLLSSVVDNVPLVASAMGMYPVADPAAVAAAADPAFMQNFVADGAFWHFLAYCAGVGGSVLIIGSAAGVVVMGIEKINFMWYLKNISLMALTGYLAGAGVYILQVLVLGW